jgi:PAS domain S-box-containing protein
MRAALYPPELQALFAAWHELKDACDGLAAENRARFEALESVADAHLMTDRDGRICEANAAAARLLGVARHRLERKPLAAFVPVAERRAFRARLAQPGGDELQLSICSRDGGRRQIAARVRAGGSHLVWRLRESG